MARLEESKAEVGRNRLEVGTPRRRLDGQVFYDSARLKGDPFGTESLIPDRTVIFVTDVLSLNVMVQQDAGELRHYYGQVLDEMLRMPIPGAMVGDGEGTGGGVVTNEFGEFALSSDLTGAEQVLWVVTGQTEVVCRIPFATES